MFFDGRARGITHNFMKLRTITSDLLHTSFVFEAGLMCRGVPQGPGCSTSLYEELPVELENQLPQMDAGLTNGTFRFGCHVATRIIKPNLCNVRYEFTPLATWSQSFVLFWSRLGSYPAPVTKNSYSLRFACWIAVQLR